MDEKRTVVDRLCFRMDENIAEAHKLAMTLFPFGKWEPRARGGLGYETSYQVMNGPDRMMMIYSGGSSQRGTMYIDITGKGSAFIIWDDPHVRECFDMLPGAKLRRMDIAADYYYGEVGLDYFKKAYEEGLFTHRRKPSFLVFGDPYGINGMTYYIGKKGQELCFKVYEKGKEQENLDFHEWVRAELTIAPSNRIKFLPISPFIEDRDGIFAGSYPALEAIMPEITPLKLDRVPNIRKGLYDVLKHIRSQYGAHIRSAVNDKQGDCLAVFDLICGDYPHPRYSSQDEGLPRVPRAGAAGPHPGES